MRSLARDACVALLLLSGCAGAGAARQDVEALRAEVRALRRENDELSRKVEALSGRMEVVTARLTRPGRAGGDPPDSAPGAAAAPQAPREATRAGAPAFVIPPDLAVVKVEPRPAAPARPARSPRVAPPVPTSVPIGDPDPERVAALGTPGRRELSAAADAELRSARSKTGVERAHALEDFVARYPRHGSADNALVEASDAYAAAGVEEARCVLARRAAQEYPAGDAMSEALERVAACERASGGADAERRVLERLVADYPGTPAAERATARLATISRSPGAAPAARTPRSGP